MEVFVCADETLSSFERALNRVPKGLVLWPFLFILLTSDLPDFLYFGQGLHKIRPQFHCTQTNGGNSMSRAGRTNLGKHH